ncbi:hypothetical protein [Pseudomonas saliphila]|uniref:hypothetical protein n=1 Tax=Pseudomonas saliphila TaxID=2586906 RepID=UPI001239BF65|nr:hypothetical protein [Pseudomonas saliphila]
MADLHIDDFYRDAAGILLSLYNGFPSPSILFVEDLIGPHEPDVFGVPAPRHLACFNAMLWMAGEGFLRYGDTIRQEGLDQCCLTERAFLMLSTPTIGWLEDDLPRSIARQRATPAQRLRDALSNQSSVELEEIVQHCFAQASPRR